MSPPNKPNVDDRTGVPFNMAIATLMALDNILNKITEVSLRITPQTIEIKKNLVIQFFNRATPLLKEEDQVIGLKMINEIPKVTCSKDESASQTVYKGINECNTYLDVTYRTLLNRLQVKGVFMPSKADPRMGWNQN